MDKEGTTLEEAKNSVYKAITFIIIGMWISVLFCIQPIAEKNTEIQQVKHENEKLTSIIIELNKE